MLTVAAASVRPLSTDSHSAFGSGYQPNHLASSGTQRPQVPVRRPSQYPYRLQRCSSERGPHDGGVGRRYAPAQYRSCAEFNGSTGTLQLSASLRLPLHRTRRHSVHLTTPNPLQRKDVFYSGSVVSLRGSATLGRLRSPPNVELAVVEAPESTAAETPTATPIKSRCGASGKRLSTLFEMLDVSLFRNCSFLVICASNVFVQLGYFVPVVFLTPYTQTLNLAISDGAFFLSVIGRDQVL